MESLGERLAAELRHAWNGTPWHGPSARDIVSRLTAPVAASRRVRGSHTAWELVRHLTLWAEVPLRRFDDPAYSATDAQNFSPPPAVGDAQWQDDVAALGAAIERLAVRVAGMSDAALAAPVGDRGYSYAFMVSGVCQHVAYHAGQMALLARDDGGAP